MHHQVSGFHRECGQEILLKTRGGFELTAQFIGFLQGRELRAGVGLVLAELANFVFLFQQCFQADLELLGRSEVRVGVDQGHTSSLLTNLLGGECQLILWPKQHHRVATNQIVRGSNRAPFDSSERGRPASLQLAGPTLSLGLKGLLGGKDHRPRGLGWRGGRIGRHPLDSGYLATDFRVSASNSTRSPMESPMASIVPAANSNTKRAGFRDRAAPAWSRIS